MRIALCVIAVLIVAGILFLCYKLHQLKKLQTMSVNDMLSYVTEDKDTFVSVAIIENGEISFHTYGSDTQETKETAYEYEIGSASKTMAALLVSRAIEEGKLSLSDSISKYLPLTANRYYPTIQRLLTHTSGYHNYYLTTEMIGNELHKENDFYGVGKEKLLKKVQDTSLKDKDYSFHYSNFGISVLGLVLENIYEKDYQTLLTEFLQNELALTDTGVGISSGNLSGYWKWKKDDAYLPAGAVISTIYDCADYMKFLMESEEPYVRNAFQILQPVDYHNTMYEKMNIEMNELAMTWIHDSKNSIYWHNGGTTHFNSYFAMSDDRLRGIVLLSNYGPNKKIPVTVIGAKMMKEMFHLP